MKRLIWHGDLEGCLLQNTEKASLIASVVRQGGSLIKLWDAAMDLGTHHTEGLKALSRMLAHRAQNMSFVWGGQFQPETILTIYHDSMYIINVSSIWIN